MRNRSRLSIILIAFSLVGFAMTSCEPLTTAEVQKLGTDLANLATEAAPTLGGTVAPDLGGYRGLVTDSIQGTIIIGAQIVFEREDGVIREETTSGSNGGYNIALPPGRYRVSAFHNDYLPYQGEGFFGVPDTKYQTGNIMMVPKIIRPTEPGGSIIMGGLEGIVMERTYGTKVSGVRIIFVSEDGSITKETISNANGSYKMELPKGRYHVEAYHDEYEPFSTGGGFFVVTGPGYQYASIEMVPKVKPTIAPPPTTTDCGGVDYVGICWHLGAEDLSCDEVCDPYGGYHDATRTYAGSDGSPASCRNVLDAMDLPMDNFYETKQGGIGCFVIRNTQGNYFGYWDDVPTSSSATSVTPGRERICACLR